jgi:hypothetical protein
LKKPEARDKTLSELLKPQRWVLVWEAWLGTVQGMR